MPASKIKSRQREPLQSTLKWCACLTRPAESLAGLTSKTSKLNVKLFSLLSSKVVDTHDGSAKMGTIEGRGAPPKREKNMTSIIATYYDFDAAVIAAKNAGNDIYKGQAVGSEKRWAELGYIKNWLLLDSGILLSVFNDKERALKEVSLDYTDSGSSYGVVEILEDNEIQVTGVRVAKKDLFARIEASKDYYLVDQDLAKKLAA